MKNYQINIFNDCSLKFLPVKKTKEAVSNTLKGEKAKNAVINIVYVDDKTIHELNKKYLKHDRTTDVISFSLEEGTSHIDGEIYISIETAVKQAKDYEVSLTNEILRLAVHGTLHLLGYLDDTIEQRQIMSILENKYINK